MAGNQHTLNLGDDELLPAWQTVIALDDVMNTSELTIVGGLMVYLHTIRGGVIMGRSTDDADFLVNAIVNRESLTAFSVAAARLGFQLKRDERYAYRFVHADGRKIDAMVPDHLPRHITIRLAQKPALEAPAGQQAIDRRDLYQLSFTSGKTVAIGVPDEIGALVAKGQRTSSTNATPGGTSTTRQPCSHPSPTHPSWTSVAPLAPTSYDSGSSETSSLTKTRGRGRTSTQTTRRNPA